MPYDGETSKPKLITNLVHEVSTHQEGVFLSGQTEGENIDVDDLELIVKKRRTSMIYSLPFIWNHPGEWEAILRIDHLQLDKGVWDFYFRYHDIDFRIKLDEETEVKADGVYNVNEDSIRYAMYRTVKDSLSMKSEAARFSLNNLDMTLRDTGFEKVMIQGKTNDAILSNIGNMDAQMVLVQRHTLDESYHPAQLVCHDTECVISLDFDYQQLIDLENIYAKQWDVYFQVRKDEEDFRFRIHLTQQVAERFEEDSRMEIEAPAICQISFYKTVKDNLSVKFHRAGIKRNINAYSIDATSLNIEGYAFLDSEVIANGEHSVERFFVIRKRESDKEWKKEIPFKSLQNDEENARFHIKIPLQELINMKTIEKEIYDMSVQIHYNGEIYERKMGFNDYTYVKDDILNKTIVKYNKDFARVYLTLTPGGNLKAESYYLSKLAYYYLKFVKKIDVALNKNKEVWLIGERANTAQDTGYHFFKYCRENHPDLEIYYVMNSNSRDARNVEKLGNVLYTGTFKHMRKSSLANTFIGSHDLDNILPLKGLELANYVNGRRIFLQHGVLGRKNVEYHKKYYRDPFHLFCVSSQPEKKLVEKKMGYKPEEVKITGLSRFDQLLKEKRTTQSILLIPTWREWLGREEQLRQSLYYQRYKSLLSNPDLHQLLEENGLTLDFYPHYRMQPFINEFQKLQSDRINVIEFGEKKVQDLLLENKLMITDYSSVSFDFNYMSKPVIFYHFDSRSFFKNGMLRPMAETFLGDICKREDDVIQSLEYYIHHDFQERPEISEKKEMIFSHIDTNNNQRIYNEIRALKSHAES